MAANQAPPASHPASSKSTRRAFFPLRRILVEVAVLAIFATLALGTVGFYCQWLRAGLAADISSSRLMVEAFWRSAQLFILESVYDESFLQEPVDLELHVARALAAAISFTVAGGVVYAVLRDSVKRWVETRTERRRGHYVVCGLGRRSIEFVRELIRDKKRVVAIELNPQGEHVLECREQGVRVLTGSATDRALLERAGVLKAGWLIAFTGDDSTNAEVAVRARQLVTEGKRDKNNPLRCRVHLVDPALSQVFKQHPVYTEETDPFDAHPFNTYENGARLLLQELLGSPHTRPHQAYTHLIIHGFGPMGQAVLLQAARMGHLGPGHDFRVTLLGVSDAAFHDFETHYPAIRKVCCIERKVEDPDDPDVRRFLQGSMTEINTEVMVVVCLEDDPKSFHAALSLPRPGPGQSMPVYVELTSPVGLVSLFEGGGKGLRDLQNLRPFGHPRETSNYEVVLQAELDRKAAAVHDYYRAAELQGHIAQWKTSADKSVRDTLGSIASLEQLDKLLERDPSLVREVSENMRPWDKLIEDFKDSNRQAADHLPIKLRHIGCYAAAGPKAHGDEKADLTPEETEVLAQMEHARWLAERTLGGWTKGAAKNPKKKISPFLVPWDDLPEDKKNDNRRTIRDIPEWLATLGEAIYRPGA